MNIYARTHEDAIVVEVVPVEAAVPESSAWSPFGSTAWSSTPRWIFALWEIQQKRRRELRPVPNESRRKSEPVIFKICAIEPLMRVCGRQHVWPTVERLGLLEY